MLLYTGVTFDVFCQLFKGIYSYEGMEKLFDFLTDKAIDNNTMVNVRFNRISMRFIEYTNFNDFIADFDNLAIEDYDELKERTNVIELNSGSFIVDVYPLTNLPYKYEF